MFILASEITTISACCFSTVICSSSNLVTKKYDSTLSDFLQLKPNLEIAKRIEILTKVADGVQALHHRERVLHADLKGQNIFLSVEQEEIKELVIADFGIGNHLAMGAHWGVTIAGLRVLDLPSNSYSGLGRKATFSAQIQTPDRSFYDGSIS